MRLQLGEHGHSGLCHTPHRPWNIQSRRCQGLFLKVAERLARADVPGAIVSVIRMGRMTALRKADGGVRGIVAGDVIRRLVARTIAQQLSQAVNPQATVVSINGVRPDLSVTMLSGLFDVDGVARFCHSFGCFMARLLPTHGKMRVVFLTQSGRRKVENREMR